MTVLEDEQPHEHVMKVRPARPGAAAVEFRFGSHDTFDVFVSAIRAEDVAPSADLVAEILDAVEKGRRGRGVGAQGKGAERRTILRLPSGDFHGREEVTLRGILGIGLGQRKVRPFAPYV